MCKKSKILVDFLLLPMFYEEKLQIFGDHIFEKWTPDLID